MNLIKLKYLNMLESHSANKTNLLKVYLMTQENMVCLNKQNETTYSCNF